MVRGLKHILNKEKLNDLFIYLGWGRKGLLRTQLQTFTT